MDDTTPFSFGIEFRQPSMPLFFLFWYLAEISLSILNWWFFLDVEKQLLGTTVARTHLAFNLVGGFSFLLIAAPLMFWTYRYGHRMLTKRRRNRFSLGVLIVYLLRDLPIWIIEFRIVWIHGFMVEIQGVSFIATTMTFLVATVVCWFKYAWRMAKYFQIMYGYMDDPQQRDLQPFSTSYMQSSSMVTNAR